MFVYLTGHIENGISSIIPSANKIMVELGDYNDGYFEFSISNYTRPSRGSDSRKGSITPIEITFKQMQGLIDLFEADDVTLPRILGDTTIIKVKNSKWLKG